MLNTSAVDNVLTYSTDAKLMYHQRSVSSTELCLAWRLMWQTSKRMVHSISCHCHCNHKHCMSLTTWPGHHQGLLCHLLFSPSGRHPHYTIVCKIHYGAFLESGSHGPSDKTKVVCSCCGTVATQLGLTHVHCHMTSTTQLTNGNSCHELRFCQRRPEILYPAACLQTSPCSDGEKTPCSCSSP